MHLVPAILLSVSGVVVATAAFLHRRDPAWQRSLVWMMGLALTQVTLAVLSALILR